MSIQAVSYVLQHAAARGHDRLSLISLANHANDSAKSWPSVQTMAHEAGISERSVQRSLRRLAAAGEIFALEISPGGRKTTTWLLVGFARWSGLVGPPTEGQEPGKSWAKPTVNQRKPAGKAQKTGLEVTACHRSPVNIVTPAPSVSSPQPRQYRHPSGDSVSPLRSSGDTAAVSASSPDPSLNRKGDARPRAASPDPSGDPNALPGALRGAPVRSDGDEDFMLDVKRTLAAIAAHQTAVINGSERAAFVGADYRPDGEDPLDWQIREAQRQKDALAAKLKGGTTCQTNTD